jgi:hypothetical protein
MNFGKMTCILAFLALITSAAEARTEISRIELADRVLQAYIDSPPLHSSMPLLVLATAEDAEVDHRLYKKLTEMANREGFVTLRLQWSFQKAKGKPSVDLARESEELGIILGQVAGSRMMKHFEIDSSKVAFIAHGLGAKVAMLPTSAATPANVKAMMILNPVCETAAGSFPKNYASFLGATYPRMVIASHGNSACPPAQIYSAGKDVGENFSIYTLPGDASFGGKEAKDTRSQEAVIAATKLWIQDLGWSSGAPIKASKKPQVKDHKHSGHAEGTHP